jgi:hypothetical protein
MTQRLQLHALYILCALAAAVLFLIWYTLSVMAATAAASAGKVSAVDAGTLTGLTLMFREVLGRIQSVWEHVERGDAQAKLADSTPPPERCSDPEATRTEG